MPSADNATSAAHVRLKKKEMSDEFSHDSDSRDSGYCDVDIAEMPTTFPDVENLEPPPQPKTSFSLDIGMDCLDISEEDENRLMNEEVLNFSSTAGSKSGSRRALGDITTAFKNRSNSVDQDESPKSRFGFAKPLATKFGRKRTYCGPSRIIKKCRAESIDENEELVATCSTSKRTSLTSTSIHRVHSLSSLERGANYAQHHQDDDDLPKMLEVMYRLDTLSPTDSQAFRRITADTLSYLMTTLSEEAFAAQYVMVDCRYPFEYNGGHIRNALNLYDPTECVQVFYNPDKLEGRIPIFYCEYSQKRGPSMAYALRRIDRQRNVQRYPHCDYQEMYVLDKGYKNFFRHISESNQQTLQSLCTPLAYIPMDDDRFTDQLRRFAFHKKSFCATSVRKDVRTKIMMRQMSAESPLSSTMSGRQQQRPVRRPLFGGTPLSMGSCSSPTAVSMPMMCSPSPSPPREPIRLPRFS